MHANQVGARSFRGGGFPFGAQPRAADTKLYDSLGLAKDASQDEIKKAYKKLALQHHPDKGGEEEAFTSVQQAFEVLSHKHQAAAEGGGGGGETHHDVDGEANAEGP